MSGDPDRKAPATQVAAKAQRDHTADKRIREHQRVRRAIILARYGSETVALAACPREIALRDAAWRYVVPGMPRSGPSLLGWREGPASTMLPRVRCDIAAAVRMPTTPTEAWAERRHWEHRAEVYEILGGGGLPLWVRARRAVLDAHLDAMFLALPDEAAREEWRRLAGEDPGPASSLATPAGLSADAGEQPIPVQAKQPARTREEARQAVRALLSKDLTDREIARRVGVSPSTVAAVRKTST